MIDLPFRGSRRHPWHGFEATRQAAMEVFDRSWHANRRELPLPHQNSTAMTGAQFEILVDGKPQSYSDLKDVAIASAELIKSHNPLSEVAVRDTKTGEITPVSYKPGTI